MNTFKENKMQSRVSVHEHDITIYDQEFVHAINFNKDLASFQKVYDKHPKWLNREMIEYVIGIIDSGSTPKKEIEMFDYKKEQKLCKAEVEKQNAKKMKPELMGVWIIEYYGDGAEVGFIRAIYEDEKLALKKFKQLNKDLLKNENDGTHTLTEYPVIMGKDER